MRFTWQHGGDEDLRVLPGNMAGMRMYIARILPGNMAGMRISVVRILPGNMTGMGIYVCEFYLATWRG